MPKGWTMAALRKKQVVQGDDQASLNHQRGGALANQVGQTWQERLDAYHLSLMRRNQVAKVFRQYPPMRSIWQHSQIIWKAEGKGPCDYCCIFNNSTAGVFDAKAHSGQKQFTWPKEQVHQLEELRALHASTAGKSPAFALVNWYEVHEVRLHPIWTIAGRTVYRASGLLVHEINWLPVVLTEWKIR
jgi:hypothetical protein